MILSHSVLNSICSVSELMYCINHTEKQIQLFYLLSISNLYALEFSIFTAFQWLIITQFLE